MFLLIQNCQNLFRKFTLQYLIKFWWKKMFHSSFLAKKNTSIQWGASSKVCPFQTGMCKRCSKKDLYNGFIIMYQENPISRYRPQETCLDCLERVQEIKKPMKNQYHRDLSVKHWHFNVWTWCTTWCINLILRKYILYASPGSLTLQLQKSYFFLGTLSGIIIFLVTLSLP